MSLLQHLLPQRFITSLTNALANCECPKLKNFLIKRFIKAYKVDLAEAKVNDIHAFPTFNAFFTRELKDGARKICMADNTIISPADGFLGQFGVVDNATLVQAKGKFYSLSQLLATNKYNDTFKNGNFATIYLAPHNYHRVHMPTTGKLEQMTYIPGKLFSVSPKTCAAIPNIFARNERVVAIFQTPIGRVAVILIGAIVVGGINTTWHGPVTPPHTGKTQTWKYPTSNEKHVKFKKGEEMGLFKVGSTVVLLFESNKIQFNNNLQLEQTLQLGNVIAEQI